MLTRFALVLVALPLACSRTDAKPGTSRSARWNRQEGRTLYHYMSVAKVRGPDLHATLNCSQLLLDIRRSNDAASEYGRKLGLSDTELAPLKAKGERELEAHERGERTEDTIVLTVQQGRLIDDREQFWDAFDPKYRNRDSELCPVCIE